MQWLSLSIWLPVASGVLLLALSKPQQAALVRWLALLAAIASLLVTLPLISGFDTSTAALQFVENQPWITRFNARYHAGRRWHLGLVRAAHGLHHGHRGGGRLGGDRGARQPVHGRLPDPVGPDGRRVRRLRRLLFYVFFEATLIPMYLIIGVWGGPRRVYAAFKFFLYTLAGSLLMLVALLYLYFQSGGSFDILTWHKLPLPMNAQTLLFFAFLAAFSVKVPMWPVHTWLPDAHVEAPTGGSVVLAAIMLKLGAYGFLRFSMPIAPDASHAYAPFIITLSLIAVIYIGLVAMVQKDMKKLVAYSSVAHMGFVTLGFFLFNDLGVAGGLVQMIAHGFVSGAMFLCIGVLYDRVHSREIADYGGVVNTMPKFAAFAVLFAMANCGLPGTAGFIGEWMVILGAVQMNFWIGALAATALIFGAAYSLWMVKRVYFGAVANAKVAALTDIGAREFSILALLAAATLAMGIYPKPFTDVMQTSVSELLLHVKQSKLAP
jgi:NADH-quinone oxidoreductase subunit M